MIKILLFFLFTFWSCFSLHAQKKELVNKQDTLYLNVFCENTTAQEAELIRIIYHFDTVSNQYVFKEFDKRGKLKQDGYITKRTGRPNGFITQYHENGNKHLEGTIDEVKKGIWIEWYQNGQLKEEIEYIEIEKGKPKIKLINYYDSTGVQLVESGHGIYKEYFHNDVNGQLKKTGLIKDFFPSGRWEGYHEDGSLYFHEDYSVEGELEKGVSYDQQGHKYEYQEPHIEPHPKNGIEAMYQNFQNNIKYPKSARRRGIEGRVYVQFFVEKNGEIIEVETIKGIAPECDKEAERVIRQSPMWNPAIQKGQPIKVKMILPITFKLI